MNCRRLLRFSALAAVALLAVSGCSRHGRLVQANVDEVADGMSKKQVESILGPPTSTDTTDLVLLKKTTYVYKQREGVVTIVFQDDKVLSKESTLPK